MTVKIRCPNCHQRLPIDSFGDWVKAYCRNCKQVVTLDNRVLAKLG